MNECPTCGRKIRGNVCPYCDEEVSEGDTAESTPVSGESLIAVFGCDHGWQADFVMSLLQSEGIPAYLESGDAAEDLHDSSDEIEGEIVIRVEEEDAERATEIIESSKHELDAGEH